MSAVEEYRKWSEDTRDWTPTEGRIKADAAIAGLEAEVEMLRWVIGLLPNQEAISDLKSRWAEGGTP